MARYNDTGIDGLDDEGLEKLLQEKVALLRNLRAMKPIDRLPLYEADVETDIRVIHNEQRARKGLEYEYFTL